jgi:hypothetical protein
MFLASGSRTGMRCSSLGGLDFSPSRSAFAFVAGLAVLLPAPTG